MQTILITGASGFIGKNLVNYLEKKNFRLVLVSRDIKKLYSYNKSHIKLTYNDLESFNSKIDAVIHLAVLNNNKDATEEDFNDINVNLFKKILNFCKEKKNR